MTGHEWQYTKVFSVNGVTSATCLNCGMSLSSKFRDFFPSDLLVSWLLADGTIQASCEEIVTAKVMES